VASEKFRLRKECQRRVVTFVGRGRAQDKLLHARNHFSPLCKIRNDAEVTHAGPIYARTLSGAEFLARGAIIVCAMLKTSAMRTDM